ncbi:hypothetical protein, partial [uncultured Desulfovibrio sp.]|uniref:hypothetical protein n=1 Tax=uncultured Desulfovibrio sp. TaxID=167968 RepID=UPI00263340FD
MCVFKLCLFGALLLDVDWSRVHRDVRDIAREDVRLEDDADVKAMTASFEATDTAVASEDAVPKALASARSKAAETAEGAPEKGREPQGAEAARLA